jgi:predicted DNA-binding protein
VTENTECRRWSKEEAIRLSFPVQSDLMVLARITGATIAAAAGFGVDTVEDFRLAVEELCLLVQRHQEGTLHLAFLPSDEEIEVRCSLSPTEALGTESPEASDDMAYQFSQQILDSISDTWGEGGDGSESYMWFRMGAAQTVDEA